MKLNKMIGIIERCAMDYKNQRLQELCLSSCNYVYIISICKNPGISQEELVKKIFVNKSNVTRNLKSLESNGYIYKEVDTKDKRINKIYPTEKAINVLPKLREVLREWKGVLLSDLSEEEQEVLEALLEKLVNNAVGYFNKTYVGE